MSTSTAQLDAFHRFATGKLEAGATDLSLEDLLRIWRTETDRAETVESIRQGVADMEAGRCHTLEEVDAEIKRRFEDMRQDVTKDSK